MYKVLVNITHTWMSKFIAHEIEVSTAAYCERN